MEKENFEIAIITRRKDDLKCCGNCLNCYLESEFCIKCKLNPGGATPHNKYCDDWRYDNLTQNVRRLK